MPIEDNSTVVPKKPEKPEKSEKPELSKNSEKSEPSEKSNSPGIHFNDDPADTNYSSQPQGNTTKQQNVNLEDDYYELEGF